LTQFALLLSGAMDNPTHARNVKKRQQDERRRKTTAKKMRESLLGQAALELNKARDDNGGRLPHKRMGHAIQALLDIGLKVNKDIMNRAMQKQKKATLPFSVLEVNVDQSAVSSLRGTEGAENIPPIPPTILPIPPNYRNINKGRPSGTTKMNIATSISAKQDCITAIALEYKSMVEQADVTYAPKGYLIKLIDEKKEEFGLPEDYYISTDTIRSRVKRKNPEPNRQTSPIQAAEESLIQLCLTMGKVRQPLTPTEGIHLMNSLIKDRQLQVDLVDYKKQRRDLGQGKYPERLGEVGRGFWYGFMKRHAHRLVTKRGERFASSRADWSKFHYIKQMYDVIYDEFVDAGVAEVLEEKVSMDREGNICEEADRFGELCDIKITHPEYILFADETGCNTNQKKDGHQAGTKFVVGIGETPKTTCSTSDHRFTLLPITSATGLPVMCILIFQGKGPAVPASWKSGIDIRLSPVRDDDGKIAIDERNFGKGKFFPDGPTCTYLGKDIPCATFVTEGGGISADILVDVLTILDTLDVFPRVPGGPIPVLIIDGHESRLDPKFVAYINDPRHMWKVCLGVPYATNYWQVGDSSEQNGTFKVLWYKEKDEVVKYKSIRHIPLYLNAEDTVPMMNRIWDGSFGRELTNKQATSDRGWYPPNRKLQSHPELLPDNNTNSNQSEVTNSQPPSSSSEPSQLNLTSGFSSTVMDTILQHVIKNGGIERRKQRLQEGSDVMKSLAEAKKLTSGVIVAQGIHSLNNPSVLGAINLRADVVREKLLKSVRMTRRELRTRIEKVRKIRESKGRGEEQGFVSWTTGNCKEYLQYKREKADPKMPTRVGLLRARCREIMGRMSPSVSPHSSDDDEAADDEAVDEAVDEALDTTGTGTGEMSDEQLQEEEAIVFSDEI
jgi:hypothetical protein